MDDFDLISVEKGKNPDLEFRVYNKVEKFIQNINI